MEALGITEHKLEFVSLFYLNVFIHSCSMQASIIKRKEPTGRGAKTHSTHRLQIAFIFSWRV